MPSPAFCHLHVHSDASLLDGATSVDALVRKALEFDQPALAITDHGVMHNAWRFHRTATREGLKPIIGMEAYVAPGHRGDKKTRTPKGGYNYHLVLLAQNAQGYRNLVKLSSLGHTEGFYHKPRVDRETLARYGEGLIVSSACMAGEVGQNLLRDDAEAARDAVQWYAKTFGDRYYLEVQTHDTPGQDRVNAGVFDLADRLGVPVVATSDAHFLTGDDHAAHDCLLCVGMGKRRDDPARNRYDNGLYLQHSDEVAARFAERPDALANTVGIAERCDLSFERKYHVPAFPVAEEERREILSRIERKGGVDAVLPEAADLAALTAPERERQAVENELIRSDVFRGASERYGDPLPDHVRTRVEYELGVITSTGYAGYHLITADFIDEARRRGIPVGPGRGSAAGSIVCYCLGITDVDPLAHDLLFERFLNPDRVSMPDIDIDFCFERRGELIEYVRDKYGSEAVGQIITFGTLRARGLVRDIGRVLGWDLRDVDKLAKAIPNDPNNALTIAEAIDRIPEVRSLYQSDARYREMLDLGCRLEGLRRHSSVHAAGVVIAPGPLDDYVPVQMVRGQGDGTGGLVTQYDMNDLEQAGMLKMDFLGLKALTVIDGASRNVEERHEDRVIDWIQVSQDDPETYAMLRKGLTGGVFQMESDLAREKLSAMQADCFNDIVAASALLRPGPLDSGMTDRYIARKRGDEEVSYPHPALQETLAPTYGIIVYQEQVMRAAQELAGYTLAEADVLRKAVGKKDADLIRAELSTFVDRCVEAGTADRARAEEIAALIETFGRYGFNKSHSVAYSVLSFRTAYLKTHYPAEYMAAMLSSVADKTDDVVKYLTECRKLGIDVRPPSVQESNLKFTVVGEGDETVIRFGLSAVRNVGEGIVREIVSERDANGPFADFFDFAARCHSKRMNRRVLESLVVAGACDDLAGNRAQKVAAAESAIAHANRLRRDEEAGQQSLFGDMGGGDSLEPSLPDVEEFAARTLLAREKEAIGVYASAHPLDELEEVARAISSHEAAELGAFRDGEIRIAGVITAVDRRVAKRSGKMWAKATLEDLSGSVSLLAFSDELDRYDLMLREGEMVVVEGAFPESDRDSDREISVRIDRVQRLSDLVAAGDVAVTIHLDAEVRANSETMERVRALLDSHQGNASVLVGSGDPSGEQAVLRAARSCVRPNPDLMRELREILGEDRIGMRRGVPLGSPRAAA